ncbi:hypothetical protein VTL71DRAFT_3653 [Oculimacula yallundae]|uniref:Uncharacterized protein n=1 Tax=Oculimacula yallundae TaxID=86028 RepID=A0ABR4C5A2_9HELO
MAGTIGRITAALTSIHNENAVSLANLNFDFTLVKLEAPREYNGLGANISKLRKVEAEEGVLHKTARKLGALFKEILPPAEDLFRAYGTRVSEISAMPSINPQQKQGIFASHAGVDTASIWAAATSGTSAISAHLLGCMLARMFTGPEAISVWVEIVQRQKESISARYGDRLYAQEYQSDCIAALQEISRAELSNWDASARAWLQSADEAKALQQKQTMLILDNASIPVNNEPDTYASVMKAWTAALEAMNNLVRGMPQTVQDGAALLAISSWHLYPDMVIYGGPVVEVKQKDPTFRATALLTLGLQHLRDDKKSVYWSLPLACLQYYGYPIHTSRSAGSETARITYHQFAYILIGCLFVSWEDFSRTNEEGLKWLQRLRCIIKRNEEEGSPRNSLYPMWLDYLLNAANDLGDCDDLERNAAYQLMNLGRRRPTFLYASAQTPPPLFSLSQIPILLSVLKNRQRIELLRECCYDMKIDGSSLIIAYPAFEEEQGGDEDENVVLNYASVMPVPQQSSKRTHDGGTKLSQTSDARHRRWITLSYNQMQVCYRRSDEFNNIPKTRISLKRQEEAERIYLQEIDEEIPGAFIAPPSPERQERLSEITELTILIQIAQRRKAIEDLGEDCLPVMRWTIDPQHGFHDEGLIFSLELDFLTACDDILSRCKSAYQNAVAVCKKFFAGTPKFAALYLIYHPEVGHRKARGSEVHLTLSIHRLQEFFLSEHFCTTNLHDHFSNPTSVAAQEELRCLKACAAMADIYKLLPGATISTLIVGQSLQDAKWIPKSVYGRPLRSHPELAVSSSNHLTLPQSFACVAMFESGTCNFDPSYLSEAFAMSSGNSLYVAAALLCDPYDQPRATELRRVVGNIGRSGITFLISPPEVKTRKPDPEKWMSINHRVFDGSLEDHFQDTSMHLSFTRYEIPLLTESDPRHIIDRSAVLVEGLISVFEGGCWVAEVDVLKAVRESVSRCDRWSSGHDHHNQTSVYCNDGQSPRRTSFASYTEASSIRSELAATSIENWDELIEAPSIGHIAIRAHKNWLARLAATAMCAKHGFISLILPENPCWICCADMLASSSSGVRTALIC